VANEEFLATWRRWTAAEHRVTGRPLPCGHFIPEELPGVLVDELVAFLG
jgi:haloacetate dehalogenase